MSHFIIHAQGSPARAAERVSFHRGGERRELIFAVGCTYKTVTRRITLDAESIVTAASDCLGWTLAAPDGRVIAWAGSRYNVRGDEEGVTDLYPAAAVLRIAVK